jgi:hypothetical protein
MSVVLERALVAVELSNLPSGKHGAEGDEVDP